MSRVHYTLRYCLDSRSRYLLWYSHDGDETDVDGVVVNQDGAIPIFDSLPSAVDYAQTEGLSLLRQDNCVLHNLDLVRVWLKRKRPGPINCNEFLSAWNLFGDVSATVSGNFDPDKQQTHRIYNKLFWGSNLPAVTPPGEHYRPLWSGAEVRVMRQVLSVGLALFRSRVRAQPKSAALENAPP